MLIIIKKNTSYPAVEKLENLLDSYQAEYRTWNSGGDFNIKVLKENKLDSSQLENFDFIEKILPTDKSLKIIGAHNPIKEINIQEIIFSQNHFHTIAGPCTINKKTELEKIVFSLKEIGVELFRAGAFKLRTSPYTFEGLEHEGLDYIQEVSKKSKLLSVSEITCTQDIDIMSEHVDILLVGTRNMFNYRLLKALGKIDNPIILKRNMSATYKEWFYAAEHIAAAGNDNIILCERGIRTFEDYTRNTLDISAIQAAKTMTNLPVIVDPSHSCGKREMVESLSKAAIAAGADGLLIEAHYNPAISVVDSKQTVDIPTLNKIMRFESAFKKYL